MSLRGIDVSEYNGQIDWRAVKDSGEVDFAIIRAGLGWTDGNNNTRRDKRFIENVFGCENNKIPYGIYHFSYCLKPENAGKEAEYIIRNISGTKPACGVWLDVESNAQIPLGREKITSIAKTECERIAAAGYNIGVYSYKYWLENYFDMSQLADYPVWLAEVDVKKPTYKGPFDIWQYSWRGTINGITGDVDMNEWINNIPSNEKTDIEIEKARIIEKIDNLKIYIDDKLDEFKRSL